MCDNQRLRRRYHSGSHASLRFVQSFECFGRWRSCSSWPMSPARVPSREPNKVDKRPISQPYEPLQNAEDECIASVLCTRKLLTTVYADTCNTAAILALSKLDLRCLSLGGHCLADQPSAGLVFENDGCLMESVRKGTLQESYLCLPDCFS